jgi:hypothetical protein
MMSGWAATRAGSRAAKAAAKTTRSDLGNDIGLSPGNNFSTAKTNHIVGKYFGNVKDYPYPHGCLNHDKFDRL